MRMKTKDDEEVSEELLSSYLQNFLMSETNLEKTNQQTKKTPTKTTTSLAVQWLRLQASVAGGMGSIPGQGTKIPHAARHSQPPPTPHLQSVTQIQFLG